MAAFIKNILNKISILNNGVEKVLGVTTLKYLLQQLKFLFVTQDELIDLVYPRGIIIDVKSDVDPAVSIGGSWKDVTNLYDGLNSNIKKYQRIVPLNSNKNSLQNSYNSYKSLNKEDYIEASWPQFETALENAKAVLDDPEATQEQVDSANSALVMAYLSLRKKA